MAVKVKNDDSLKGEFARRFKANPFLFIGTLLVLVIVIVAFVIVPAMPDGSIGRAGGAELNFGSYNNIPITYTPGGYFSLAYDNASRSRQQSDANNQSLVLEVWREAFEKTAIHTALLDEQKRAGYVIPAKEVDRQMAQLPMFYENDHFSVNKYRAYPDADKKALWKQIQESMLEEQYRQDLQGLKVSSRETSFLLKMAVPQRSFDMVSIPIHSYPDSEVQAYAQANPALFMVTHLSKISIKQSENEAKRLLASIRDGQATFEDLAQAHSIDTYAEKMGDMGIKLSHELEREAANEADRTALAALPKGALSEVFATADGWAFVRANEEPVNIDTADPTNLLKVRSYMLEYLRGTIEEYLLKQANNMVSEMTAESDDSASDAETNGLSGFDRMIQRHELTKKSFGPIPVNYRGLDLFPSLRSAAIPELKGADEDAAFWKTAFDTPLLSVSKPFVFGDSVVILYPKERSAEASSETIQRIETAYPSYYLSYVMERSITSHVLNSNKLKDNFYNAFFSNYQF
ncbi:peptidylprolyl isomerase [Breznakiellaceae bacterium SP9]